MKNNIEFKVVIIGGIHHNTLGVLRSLGEQRIDKNNIELIIVAKHPNNNFIVSSRYISKSKVYYTNDYRNVVSILLRISESFKKKVIICCSDSAAEVVMSNANLLQNFFHIPRVNCDIHKLMEKQEQDCIAERNGLKVPLSLVVKKDQSIQWTDYPCITKPFKSGTIGKGKGDIYISNDVQELTQALEKTESPQIQIQRYIDKEFEYQLIGLSLNDGKKVIIPGFTKLIRQPLNTNTGYLKYIPIKYLNYDTNSVKRFLIDIGYNGLFSLEYLRGKDGIDYFLEINLRNDGNAYCVKSAGINLPYIWCYYSVFGKLPDMRLSFSKEIHFMPELQDAKQNAKKIGLFKWFCQFLSAKSHSIFNLKDPVPFFVKVISR